MLHSLSSRRPGLPLLLIGYLAAVIPLGLRPSIRRRYEEIELRRMRAHDLG